MTRTQLGQGVMPPSEPIRGEINQFIYLLRQTNEYLIKKSINLFVPHKQLSNASISIINPFSFHWSIFGPSHLQHDFLPHPPIFYLDLFLSSSNSLLFHLPFPFFHSFSSLFPKHSSPLQFLPQQLDFISPQGGGATSYTPVSKSNQSYLAIDFEEVTPLESLESKVLVLEVPLVDDGSVQSVLVLLDYLAANKYCIPI